MFDLADRVVVMSEGRIEQIGTPSEIYNFPATPFVASFVGTLNLLHAKVVDPTGGGLEIEGQRVRTDRAVAAPSGSIVSVALRPEAITLGDGVGGANPELQALVVRHAQLARQLQNHFQPLEVIIRIQARVAVAA